jgi:phospholipid transport system substrate-binding protein
MPRLANRSHKDLCMTRKFVMIAAALFALLSVSASHAADTAADPAAEQIRSFYDSLVDTMKRGPQLGAQGRSRALAPAVDRAYDLTDMMQLVVGPGWSTITDSDKTVLIAAFRQLILADYASNFAKYSGERFDIDPTVLQRSGDKIVQTKLVPSGDKPVALIYRMREQGGTWKIIDVYLAGYVSQAALKRSDFAATLASGGPKALAAKINALADSTLAGGKSEQ